MFITHTQPRWVRKVVGTIQTETKKVENCEDFGGEVRLLSGRRPQ